MKSVQVCSAAETDFTEALRYYANRNPEVALQFDAELDGALRRIAAAPEQFPAVDDCHRYVQLRRFPFLIIFRLFRDEITVIAVAHTHRVRPTFGVDADANGDISPVSCRLRSGFAGGISVKTNVFSNSLSPTSPAVGFRFPQNC